MRSFNIKDTHVGKYYPLLVILSASAFEIISTENLLKGYSPRNLVFGHDMILLTKQTADWTLIRQKNQTQMNKYNICKNNKRVDHAYIVVIKVILDTNAAYKYETPYKEPFLITQC